MTADRLPKKRDVALALLEGSTVFVHLDPRAEAVSVPPWFKKQPQLVLQVGLNMPVPITDLNLDEESLSCTLSFNRSPHFCMVPWGSVYALVGEDGRGMVWPEDVPPEVAAQAKPKQTKASHLKAVPEGATKGVQAAEVSPVRPAVDDSQVSATHSTQEKQASRKKAKKRRAKKSPALEEVRGKPAREAESGGEGETSKTSQSKRKLPPYLRVVK